MHAERVHQKAHKSQRAPIGLDHHGLGQSPPPPPLTFFSGYGPCKNKTRIGLYSSLCAFAMTDDGADTLYCAAPFQNFWIRQCHWPPLTLKSGPGDDSVFAPSCRCRRSVRPSLAVDQFSMSFMSSSDSTPCPGNSWPPTSPTLHAATSTW